MSDRKKLKVGVHEGGGPPPGYEWNVGILDLAYEEAMGCLTEAQYQHIALQVKDLATHEDPTHSSTLSIRAINAFWELRDKGGPLGKKNVRVFFGIDADNRAIIVIGLILKQNDGSTPQGDKIRMSRRWRNYNFGNYGKMEGK